MWTNTDQANEYLKDLFEGCDIDLTSSFSEKDLEECFDGGSKWSVVWSLNAITVLMIAAANLLMMLGAYQFHARGLASCCLCLLGCVNLAAIITTGVFRFRTMGKLAALSTTAVNYNGVNDATKTIDLNDDRTYESDGNMIMGLWIAALCLCCCNCFLGMVMKPKPTPM